MRACEQNLVWAVCNQDFGKIQDLTCILKVKILIENSSNKFCSQARNYYNSPNLHTHTCMQWKDITSKINSNLFIWQIYIKLFLPISVLHNYWIGHNIKFCSPNLNLCILKIPIMHKVTGLSLCRVVNSGINIRYFYHFLPIFSVT